MGSCLLFSDSLWYLPQGLEINIFQIKIIKYGIVGGSVALIDICIFSVFAKYIGYNYLWVSFYSFLLCTYLNFYLSKKFVFRNLSTQVLSQFIKILLISTTALIMTQLLLILFIEKIQVEMITSKIFVTGIVFFWNYFARKYLVFNK